MINQNKMKLNKEDRREEVAGISTALLIIAVTLCCIGATIQVIFNIL